MKKQIALILSTAFIFTLLSCKGPAAVEEEMQPSNKVAANNEPEGKVLYDKHCMACHDTLADSTKIDTTYSKISYSISDVRKMNYLSFLSYEEIMEINKVLSSKNPMRIKPIITAAAPTGKYPGATQSLELKITTDMPTTCFFDSIDVPIAEMRYQMDADSSNLNHNKTLSALSAGASYIYYVHCKDFTFGNVTKVSQYISFSTDSDVVDTTSPTLNGFNPTQPLLGGTEKAKFYFNTNENASCRYSTDSNATYNQMSAMSTTGTLGHVNVVSGLSSGSSYTFYVICADSAANESSKGTINFSVLSNINGSQLYTNNCASCHGSVAGSSKRGSSASTISNAILNYNAMRIENLQFLSPTQINAISGAL